MWQSFVHFAKTYEFDGFSIVVFLVLIPSAVVAFLAIGGAL